MGLYDRMHCVFQISTSHVPERVLKRDRILSTQDKERYLNRKREIDR